MEHEAYPEWQSGLITDLKLKMDKVQEVFSGNPHFSCSGGGGAFYVTIHGTDEIFDCPVPYHSLNDNQLNLIRNWIRPGINADYKLVYYLLAVYGICVVPLSSFGTGHNGFRFTLLEQDKARFESFLSILDEALGLWSKSATTKQQVVA